ncbi:MAG: hypothetical protein P4L91_20940 [Burkholderiaceae bacterium]|nr:hypothetical protein [Burkholderiaceae bacterium]
MSTKSSLAHGPHFHLYSETFDDAHVYLALEGVQFKASERDVEVAIPLAIWEAIRRHTPVDLSFVDKTDEDIRRLVESETEERTRVFAEAEEDKRKVLRLFGASIYGQPDEPREIQFANGLAYYTRLRARHSKLKQDIEDMRRP